VRDAFAPAAGTTSIGIFGAVFLLVAVLSFTAREVCVALDNIRDGIRPSDDEVRKQWDIIITESRRRRAQAQEQLQG